LCVEALTAGSRPYAEASAPAAVVVLADSDLELAARQITTSAFCCAGQAPSAVKRVVVERSAYRRVVELLSDRAAQLHVGDPVDPTVEMGPLEDAEAVRRVARDIQCNLADGCELLIGGDMLESSAGHFFSPTVLSSPPGRAGAAPASSGPVITVSGAGRFDSLAELAGSPVAAGILSDDLDRARRLAGGLNASIVRIGSPPPTNLHESLFGHRVLTPDLPAGYPLTQTQEVTA
jgi:acyl-CoA reductase-like NAD-dependent aldehyde dehydrogenase